ncbi:hypothetical protein CGLO_13895 [Colletotrichum gloeosporioides Cg-14]|uniref:Uncharacterized protein n=1 Tax=Colletotrichum gloeosporioides (strain Cg-14) TaxID=1237896 RepID=T0JVI3_COLGC|nr:hypothetical protein CGLO_13895 [Colletotrichum gloeosporioides Cg-14]
MHLAPEELMVSRAEAFYRAFIYETGTETDPEQYKEIYRKQNIEIVQARRSQDDGYFFFWRFDQRFVKNNRNTDNKTFGSAFRHHDVLMYSATAMLLSLASADQATFGFDSLESLWQLKVPNGENKIILRWRRDVLDQPIAASHETGRSRAAN